MTVNEMCAPELDPGLEKSVIIKKIIGIIGQNLIWVVH